MSEPIKRSTAEKFIIGATVFIIMALLMAIAIPHFNKPRVTTSASACMNQLCLIDAAAKKFARIHNLTNGAPINFPNDLTPYIKLNSAECIPPCPAGGVYNISKVGEPPTCSLGSAVAPWHLLHSMP